MIPKKVNNLIGKTFGELTVIEYVRQSKAHRAIWKCLCKCGNVCNKTNHALIAKGTNNCGCQNSIKRSQSANKRWEGHIKIIKPKHPKRGLSKTRLYSIFQGMKERCYRPNHVHYHNYGGKGVSICGEWLNNFETFYNWALQNDYNENLSIDRINGNLNYEPSNCRWATSKEQMNNVNYNRLALLNGEMKTVAQIADEYRFKYTTILERLNHGKTGADIIAPLCKHNHVN